MRNGVGMREKQKPTAVSVKLEQAMNRSVE
jgi:hypothetical protein